MLVFSAMPELVYHLTYIVQPRYSGALLNGLEFYNKTSLSCAPSPCQEGELPWPGQPGQCFRIKVQQLKHFWLERNIFPPGECEGSQ